MTVFYATLLDETRCEFSATSPDVASREAAREYFEEQYPESRVQSIVTPAEDRAAEHARYMRYEREFMDETGGW